MQLIGHELGRGCPAAGGRGIGGGDRVWPDGAVAVSGFGD